MGLRERLSARSRDLAVDLGTANTLIHERGVGIVLDEPSVVAVDGPSGRLVAAGSEAHEMVGRTPDRIRTVRPLRDGVIVDPELTEEMLRLFVERVRPTRLFRPRMVVCVPSGITGVERRALEDAAVRCGARQVFVVEEPLAAAIGAGLAVTDTVASMVVDIGGGTTDVAVVALGGVVASRSIDVAGAELERVLLDDVRDRHGLLLGPGTAERVIHEIGSCFPLGTELETRVRGRDVATGLPRPMTLTSPEVRRAVDAPVLAIVELVREVLHSCPPELAGDILDKGITLTGGGALLRGIGERLHHELGVPVTTADDPLRAVVRGAGRCVDELEALHRVLVEASVR